MKKIISILTVILILSSFSSAVYAESLCEVSIGGSEKVVNNEDLKTGRHTFVLKGKDNAPMPEGSEGDEKRVTVSTGESFDFGHLSFKDAGSYDYTVYRDEISCCDLEEDDSVFDISVAVTEDGEHTMIIKNRGSGRKTERITYLDRYTANGNTGPVKTGDTEDLMAFVGVFLSALIILYICMVRIAEDKKTIR